MTKTFEEGRAEIARLCGFTALESVCGEPQPVFSGAYHEFSAPYLKRLPIVRIDFSNREQKRAHDRVVALVDSMIALHQQAAAAKSLSQKTVLQRQIEATNAEIDRLVCSLYGLTKADIATIGRGQ